MTEQGSGVFRAVFTMHPQEAFPQKGRPLIGIVGIGTDDMNFAGFQHPVAVVTNLKSVFSQNIVSIHLDHGAHIQQIICQFRMRTCTVVPLDVSDDRNEAGIADGRNCTQNLGTWGDTVKLNQRIAGIIHGKNPTGFELIRNIRFEIDFTSKIELHVRIAFRGSFTQQLVPFPEHLRRVFAELSPVMGSEQNPGLGKTLETIAYLETLKENDPVLIVCPKSVTYNWLYEFEKWDSSYECTVIEGSKDLRDDIIKTIGHERKVYITSYDTLRNDVDTMKTHFFNIVILDESQYIKNAGALKSKAVKQINCRYRFSLTGTPVENGLSDLWSIFDFIMPGYLLDYNDFKQEYEFAFDEESENEEVKNKLIAKITPFVFKRTKDEVLEDLPGKTTTTVTIAMTEKQQDIYSTYLRKTKLMLKNKENTTHFRILQGILRLRQICVDPSAFLLNYDEIPAKISFALEMIDEVLKKDSKVIVYSSFVSVLDHVANCLKDESKKYYRIDGSTNAHDRVKLSEKFNTEDEVKIMLVSLKAGGTGLNLIGADTIIILDPWWNAAVEEQAADRAYRIGQTKSVNVFKLIAHNSIEEKIIKLQNKKQALYEKLIQGDTEGITGLTEEDINYIFS